MYFNSNFVGAFEISLASSSELNVFIIMFYVLALMFEKVLI